MAAAFLDLAMCSANQLGATNTIFTPYGLLLSSDLGLLAMAFFAGVAVEGVGSEIKAIASHRCHRGLNSSGNPEDSSISTGDRLGELDREGDLETEAVEMLEKDEEEDQDEDVDETEQPDSCR
jgi:hypothetical protein